MIYDLASDIQLTDTCSKSCFEVVNHSNQLIHGIRVYGINLCDFQVVICTK